MQKTIKSIRAILLAIVLVVGVFAVIPAPVYAAQTIDITTNDGGTTIGGGAALTSGGTGGVDSWSYNGADLLTLTDAGPYTLTGTNGSLTVYLPSSATGANVTLSGVNITASSDDTFITDANVTVTLIGANSITATGNSITAIVIQGVNMTIEGSAQLTATASSTYGIVVQSGGNLSIVGNASVTAVGADGAISTTNPIAIGDNASLTMTNNSGAAETHTFTSTGSTYRWLLTGAATLASGSLTDSSITVNIPAGQTGTVQRELIPGGGNTGGGGGGGTTGGGGGATTTGVSPKTDDATGGNMFLIVMMLLLAAGAVYTGRKAAKANK